MARWSYKKQKIGVSHHSSGFFLLCSSSHLSTGDLTVLLEIYGANGIVEAGRPVVVCVFDLTYATCQLQCSIYRLEVFHIWSAEPPCPEYESHSLSPASLYEVNHRKAASMFSPFGQNGVPSFSGSSVMMTMSLLSSEKPLSPTRKSRTFMASLIQPPSWFWEPV